jgi:hypothetical protein
MPGGGKGGGASSTVTVHNGPISVDADSTVDIVGLNDIKVTARLEPSPLKTESVQKVDATVDAKADVTSDSKSAVTVDLKPVSVDLKPIALDLCLDSKLPLGEIEQPFGWHVGLTWFGLEVFGVNFGGQSRVVLRDLPRKPAVEWPAQQNAAPPCTTPGARSAPPGPAARPDDTFPPARERGLRVRIK